MESDIFDWNEIPVILSETRAVRKFFSGPTATLTRFSCHATTINPGEASHPPHQHDDEELIIVKEGEITFMREGQEQLAGAGSVIFQAPNEMHGIRNAGDMAATYYVIRWISPNS
jgi:quercetin dioxygenase-like cupin family protein